MVHWLKLHTPNAGGLGSIAGEGTRSRIPHLKLSAAKETLKKKKNEMNCTVDFSVSCKSLILFYTLLAFVCYWQFLKIRCEMEEESSRLSPMGNSDK